MVALWERAGILSLPLSCLLDLTHLPCVGSIALESEASVLRTILSLVLSLSPKTSSCLSPSVDRSWVGPFCAPYLLILEARVLQGQGVWGGDYVTIIRKPLSTLPHIPSLPRRERSKVPYIVRQCVEEVEKRGIEEVGIYRISGVATDIQALKAVFDASESGRVRPGGSGDTTPQAHRTGRRGAQWYWKGLLQKEVSASQWQRSFGL